jgi:hypothetical protein
MTVIEVQQQVYPFSTKEEAESRTQGAPHAIRVLYSTEALPRRNADQPGKGCERSFASLDVAKSAPFPDGCTFAYIPLEDGGSWVYHSAKFAWEFRKAK